MLRRALLLVLLPSALTFARDAPRPDIVLITVDTLRPDHLSGYGYERETSPHLDKLMARGVRFSQVRTPVPLTCPAFASMLTEVEPQLHGSTRNGIRVRPDLPSFPKSLASEGYATAAFVSNWALQERLCGLAEHFGEWREVLKRRRWLFSRREADARDITAETLDWIRRATRRERERPPLFVWAHYMDPHSPYLLKRETLSQLDLGGGSFFSLRNRYDTEIAYADRSIGKLLAGIANLLDPKNTILVFTADHGESLGDHGYWGHGKHVYEASLRVPLAIVWPGRIAPAVIDSPALNVDVGPTLAGLLGIEAAAAGPGYDWAGVLTGDRPAPPGRTTRHQAHRGTVSPGEDPGRVRRKGLLEVGVVERGRKEVLALAAGARRVFDTIADPREKNNLVPPESSPGEEVVGWRDELRAWLEGDAGSLPETIADEDLERLKALGYLD